jgi:hypothetical protein
MKALAASVKEKLLLVLISLIGIIVVCALATQLFFVFLDAIGKSEYVTQLSKEFSWKFDNNFRNSPDNIHYNADEQIYVQTVTNLVKVGKLAGNRNLEFGVKNILEEFLQEKGYNLSPLAPNYLDVDIIYLDILTTKKNISVFHKNEEEVVIRLKGTLYKDGKKEKEIMVEESSSEISMSTLIIDEGGKFNQASLSNALKKGCDKLITKLFTKE